MSNIDKQAQGEKTRETFERWAEQSGALPWGILKKHRNEDGSYPGPHYTYMWHAWNACTEALLDELEAAEYTAAVRLEALDNRISELNTMRYRIKTLNGTVDIVDGQRDRWMERCKDAEAKLEAAEKRIADYQDLISGLVGVSSSILREVERINNAAAAGKGEAS